MVLKPLLIGLVCLLAPLDLWCHLRPARAQFEPRTSENGSEARVRHIPSDCDFIQTLAVSFLEGNQPPPAAFSITSGTIASHGEAQFEVFAINDPQDSPPHSYADVTTEVRSHAIHVQVRAAPGSESVAGKVYYTQADVLPRLIYIPNRQSHRERTALITFDYRCWKGQVYRTTFTLNIAAKPHGA